MGVLCAGGTRLAPTGTECRRAVEAHQLEGGWDEDGRGPSVSDVMTGGSNTVKRRITDGVVEGE